MYRRTVKGIIDRVVAAAVLIPLLILMAVVAVVIKISDPKAPVIFRQKRCGKDRVPFVCYKFRTMSVSAPKNVPTRDLEEATSHITPVGKILRKWSIDEIPQIFNILKGEMSFVGPRPVIFEEEELLKAREEAGAMGVFPGMTGLAQINGRDEVDDREKARLDGLYAKNLSPLLDAKIFLWTIPAVIFKKGIREGKIGRHKKDAVADDEEK
jgi:O-antigen biosynthesis protein WbqP